MNYIKVEKDSCVGCRMCELICSVEHYDQFNSKKSRVRVEQDFPVPGKAVICRQCKNPLCVEACPTDALGVGENWITFNLEECISCYKCLEACPFAAIFKDETADGVLKCDLCGGEPRCVDYCPVDALIYKQGE